MAKYELRMVCSCKWTYRIITIVSSSHTISYFSIIKFLVFGIFIILFTDRTKLKKRPIWVEISWSNKTEKTNKTYEVQEAIARFSPLLW